MTPQLKICGINDAAFAAEAARVADYLGFIFEPSSPRFVTPAQAIEIKSAIRTNIQTPTTNHEPPTTNHQPRATNHEPRFVGVFVKQSLDEILAIAREVGLDIVQLHRAVASDEVAALHAAGLKVWSTCEGTDGTLVDSPKPGSGQRSDWTRVRELSGRGVFTILAGGLSAANIKDAALTGASVLDVNSSLEISPGRKSVAKLRELASQLFSA